MMDRNIFLLICLLNVFYFISNVVAQNWVFAGISAVFAGLMWHYYRKE
jgi:hypothetical protein